MNFMSAFPGDKSQKNAPCCAPCPDCGSGDVAAGIQLNQSAQAGPFGLVYKALGNFRGTERLYADLCRNCGSVTRIFVKNPQRNWIRE